MLFPYGVKNAEDTIFFGHLQVYAQNIVYYNLLLYRIIEEKGSASRCYDSTELGLRHVVTIRAVEDVKMSLRGSRKQNAVFDSICYQLLSNTVAFFVKSNDLSFKQFNKVIRRNNLLPLDVHNMYLYRNKAILMNYSFPLFYFLSWLKHNICLSHINFFRK